MENTENKVTDASFYLKEYYREIIAEELETANETELRRIYTFAYAMLHPEEIKAKYGLK